MLNSSGESGHPCLVPDFKGNAFNFSPLRIMFAVGLSCIAFIMLRYVPSIPASHGCQITVTSLQIRENKYEQKCKNRGVQYTTNLSVET